MRSDAESIRLPSLLKSIWIITRIVIPSFWSIETLLVFVQICLSVGYAWAYVAMSNNIGYLFSAVEDQDKPEFVRWSLWLFMAAAIGSVCNSLILATGDYMCNGSFRVRMSSYLLDKYVTSQTYFKMVHLDRRITDPDTRLGHDVDTLFEHVKLILFGTPMYVGYFATTATSVYFFVTLAQDAGWFVPVGCIVFFAVSTLVSVFCSAKPTEVTGELSAAKSKYYHLQQYFASHSEHIAFLHGHRQEVEKIMQQLRIVSEKVTRVALWRFPLNSTTMLFYWGNTQLSYMMPGFAWLMLDQPFNDDGKLLNVSSSSYSFINTMATYLLLFQEWTVLQASLRRVMELVVVMDEVASNPDYRGGAVVEMADVRSVTAKNVTIKRPNSQKILLRDISFTVDARHSVVIMGPSGIGKSSLLRVLGGLWPADSGTITRPLKYGFDGVMFVPQKPYLTFGSLMAQISYPVENGNAVSHSVDGEETVLLPMLPVSAATPDHDPQASSPPQPLSETTATEMLESVGLDYLVRQFDLVNDQRDWSQVLSVGEQQRIGIARVLYHRPAVAIMDESTSAIDEPNEDRVLRLLRQADIALLSVAHRSTVKRFHDQVLSISLDGKWELCDVPDRYIPS